MSWNSQTGTWETSAPPRGDNSALAPPRGDNSALWGWALVAGLVLVGGALLGGGAWMKLA